MKDGGSPCGSNRVLRAFKKRVHDPHPAKGMSQEKL